MALYAYQAFTKEGRMVTGRIEAHSIAVVRETLTSKQLYPIKIELAEESSWQPGQSLIDYLRPAISLEDKIFFTKQLAVLLKSGIALLPALELLIEQSEGRLKNIVIDLKNSIKEGVSLADSLSKYPHIFDSIYTQLVRAGEASGKLEVILDRLNHYLLRQAEIRKRIKKAVNQPLINLVLILGIAVFLLTTVIPSLAETISSLGVELPLITRITIWLSNFFSHNYIYLIVGAITVSAIYSFWSKTPTGRRAIDTVKLKIPVVSYFTRIGAVIQFSRTLGILLEAGVNLAESLFIVSKVVENSILTDALISASDNIIKQGKIAEYLKQTKIFPPVAIYLINTGEQSGYLDSMLISIAENYESELNDYADSLTSKIAPAMTILTMCVVGPIILSILLPIMQAAGTLTNV